MSASSYLKELASMLGLCYVEKVKPFDSKKDPMLAIRYAAGSIIGARGGFLTVLSLISSGHDTQLCILIRYPKVLDVNTLSAAVQDAFRVTKFQLSKKAKVGADCLTLNWRYAIKKPGKEDVVRAVDEVIAALSTYVPPFSGKCEECSQVSAGGIMLLNGVPCYLCTSCQQRISDVKQREAEEYAKRDMGFARAFALATGAALLCAFALSWVYYFFDNKGQLPIKAIVIFPVFIGLVAALVFAKTATRIDVKKQGVPLFVLCFVLSFAATVGYSVLLPSRAVHLSSLWFIYVRFAKFWISYHLRGEGILFVLGYVLSGVCCVGLVNLKTAVTLQNAVRFEEPGCYRWGDFSHDVVQQGLPSVGRRKLLRNCSHVV